MDLGEIIGAVIWGTVAGYLGRLLLPGRDPMGFLGTLGVGIAGSLLGWFVFAELIGIGDEDKFDFWGLPGAIIGTMLLLYGYRKIVGGPEEREELRP